VPGISLGIRLTIESDILCAPWSEFHAMAEELIGSPIYTHEFALEEVRENLNISLIARDEGVPCRFVRRLGPIDTLRLLQPDKPILGIDKETGRWFQRGDSGVRP